jgi:hypothetical protein
MPQGLAGTVGSELVKAKGETGRHDWSGFGELVGSSIGGYQKSLLESALFSLRPIGANCE